jgi:hypothetical protein
MSEEEASAMSVVRCECRIVIIESAFGRKKISFLPPQIC